MPNRKWRRRERMDEQCDGREGLDRPLLVVATVYYSPTVIAGVLPLTRSGVWRVRWDLIECSEENKEHVT